MVLTLSNPLQSAQTHLALEVLLPSGLRLVSTRAAEGEEQQQFWTWQDIRDDRISTYLDLPAKASRTLRFHLNAAFSGRFVMPGVQFKAMYNPDVSAVVPGGWVDIAP